ncbi:hypothetical protein ACSFBI_11600 [Variovorax sp. RB3P1]|uniref:hypothetical protein n=1 Tax=Variovorax sp. RB3P1 TaxID=3443732 RepID=UPI003F46E5D5
MSAIALEAGINADLLFKWRRDTHGGQVTATTPAVLLPVHVVSDAVGPRRDSSYTAEATTTVTVPATRTSRLGVIELEIADAQLRLRAPSTRAACAPYCARCATAHDQTRRWHEGPADRRRDGHALRHGQPHSNVYAPRGVTAAALATEVDFKTFLGLEQANEVNSFAKFVQAQEANAGPPSPVVAPDHGLSVEQLHKFHFARSSNWYVSNGRSGPAISATEEVVTWISSCALHIKHQFAFVLGS